MLPFTVHPVGESALLAVFTQRIAPEIGAAVAALNTRVLAANIPGVGETVPAVASLMVTYDPLVTAYDAVAFVARHAGLTEQEVIALHTGRDYRIYMLGFLPGFPYLGGLDERLFTPRLGTPRTAIPAGSVGIGGEQTGIYPIASPGGWQLIGRTPLKLFDPAAGTLPYAAGDRIRFTPITKAEFNALAQKEGAV